MAYSPTARARGSAAVRGAHGQHGRVVLRTDGHDVASGTALYRSGVGCGGGGRRRQHGDGCHEGDYGGDSAQTGLLGPGWTSFLETTSQTPVAYAGVMTAVDNGVDTWSLVRERLVGYAMSLGVSFHDAQDCAQETIRRALDLQVPYADADDLLRWCQRVAHNLVMDEHRQRRRWWLGAFDASVPTQALAADVADGVANRDLLQRTLTAVEQLPPTQREAIVNLLDGATGARESRQEQVRAAVARNRARTALRGLVGYGAAVAALAARFGRRLVRTVAPAGALATAAFLLTPALVPGASPAPPSYDAGRAVLTHPAHRPTSHSTSHVHAQRVSVPHGAVAVSGSRPGVRIQRAGLVGSVETAPASPERYLVCLKAPTAPSVCVK